MIGALNKLPVAVSGMIFFADPVTVRSVSAVTLGFAAGLLYTHAKQLSNEAKKNAEASYAKLQPGRDADGYDPASVPLLDQQQDLDKVEMTLIERDLEAGTGGKVPDVRRKE